MHATSVSTSENFGKYRLVRKIAEGGMASVYLASSVGPGGFEKPCAIKRIRPEFSSLPAFRDMLIREAKVAALLNHPNIVQVFDFGEVDGEYFLTMEWVDGLPLQRVIAEAARRGTVVDLGSSIEILASVARALMYVHSSSNLIHRDVSPSNILLSTNGAVKLTDFGVVKILEAPTGTDVGVIKGKYAYMSPEQLKGQPLDARSDIFSLGVVSYELLTGRRLFRRMDVASTIAAVLGSKVPKPSSLRHEIPPEIDRIVQKALAKNRDQRYQSAGELLADLEPLADSHGWTRTSTHRLGSMVREGFNVPEESNDRLLGDVDLERLSTPSLSQTDVGLVGRDTYATPLISASSSSSSSPWIAALIAVLAVFGTLWFWLTVLA